MDSVTLAVGILILAPVEGPIKVDWITAEVPVQACREAVAEKAKLLAPQYERVSGFCYVLPPKPAAAPQPVKGPRA